MKVLSPNNGRWLGGITIGVVIGQALHEGTGALALLAVGLFGKWLLSKVASTFFDDEITQLKERMKSKDPVKRQIWAHAKQHRGRFRDCREPACNIW